MIAPPHARLVALLGYPVEHSLSPAMHNAAFQAMGIDWRYTLHSASSQELGATVRHCVEEGYVGWNVTVPHKESIVAYLDEASAEVRAVGAANTVQFREGRLVGYNTDVAGFLAGLDEAGGIAQGSRTVILGAGGAARAVAWALAKAGHQVLVLARNAKQAAALSDALSTSGDVGVGHGNLDAEALHESLANAALLVNCTPAGMWPHIDASPLPEDLPLPGHLLVYDLVYRPRPTRLLEEARAAGCRTQDGLTMLVHQGAAAFQIWTGVKPPVDTMRQACLDALAKYSDRKQEE